MCEWPLEGQVLPVHGEVVCSEPEEGVNKPEEPAPGTEMSLGPLTHDWTCWEP